MVQFNKFVKEITSFAGCGDCMNAEEAHAAYGWEDVTTEYGSKLKDIQGEFLKVVSE